MTVAGAGRVLALRNGKPGRPVPAEPGRAPQAGDMPRGMRRRRATALARAKPASVVTFAGVQGGAGVTTATMLIAAAVTAASDCQALAVDVAGTTAGGLGGLARGWSQVPARAMAELMLSGARIERPYMTTAEGVYVISAPPDQFVKANATGHELLGRLQAAMRGGASDAALAAMCRDAVDMRGLGYEHERGDEGTAALAQFLVRAQPVFSLLALDLGVGDQQELRPLLSLADLHVWVLVIRPGTLEYVRAQLMAQPRLAEHEALLVWTTTPRAARTAALRSLSADRGCPLVKLPAFDEAAGLPGRVSSCVTSLEALCRLLP